MTSSGRRKLLTTTFALVSCTSLVVFTSFQLLIPTLPIYITQQIGGQQADIGLVMGAPALASMVFCLFLGRVMDRVGRRPVLLLGVIGFVISGALYNFAASVPTVVALRFLNGAAIAATISAMNTMIADIAPASRRGEAMGYFNVIGTASMAIGPPVGVAILGAYDFTGLFAGVTLVALVALGIASRVPETMVRRAVSDAAAPTIRQRQVLRSMLLPALVMLTVTGGYGSIMAFLPIYALQQGVDNPGVFFSVYAITLMAARLFAGRLSDRFGRRRVLLPGLVLAIAGVSVLTFSASLPAIIGVGILFGLGFGSAHVALMALTVDSVDTASRGAALGYFQSAFELGLGSGTFIFGMVAQSWGFQNMYTIAATIPFLGLVAFLVGERAQQRRAAAEFAMPKRE